MSRIPFTNAWTGIPGMLPMSTALAASPVPMPAAPIVPTPPPIPSDPELEALQREYEALRRENNAIQYAIENAAEPGQLAHIHRMLLEKRGGRRSGAMTPMEEVEELPNVYDRTQLSPLAGLTFPVPEPPQLTPEERERINAYRAWRGDFRAADEPTVWEIDAQDPALRDPRVYMEMAKAAGEQARRGEAPTSWPGAWKGPMRYPATRPMSTTEAFRERSPEAYEAMEERAATRAAAMQAPIESRALNVEAIAAQAAMTRAETEAQLATDPRYQRMQILGSILGNWPQGVPVPGIVLDLVADTFAGGPSPLPAGGPPPPPGGASPPLPGGGRHLGPNEIAEIAKESKDRDEFVAKMRERGASEEVAQTEANKLWPPDKSGKSLGRWIRENVIDPMAGVFLESGKNMPMEPIQPYL